MSEQKEETKQEATQTMEPEKIVEPQVVEPEAEENVCKNCGYPVDEGEEECENCECPTDAEKQKTWLKENGDGEQLEPPVIQDGRQQLIVVNAEETAKPTVTQQPLILITLKPKTEQLNAWVKVITTMQKLGISDATFTFNGNLHVCKMDSGRVDMVDAEIDMGLGISPIITESPPVIRIFTMNLMQLKKALRMYEPTIDVGEQEAVFSTKTAIVTVPLQEDSDLSPLPKLVLQTSTSADLKEMFSEMAKYLSTPPTSVEMIAADGKLTFKAENTDGQKFEMRNFNAKGPDARVTYSTSLLKAFRSQGYGDNWTFAFANDTPIKAEQTLTRTEYNVKQPGDSAKVITATITAYVAPRIETE